MSVENPKPPKTGIHSKSYNYWLDRIAEYKLEVTPDMMQFVFNLIYSLRLTRMQSIEYLEKRKKLPRHRRSDKSIEFLTEAQEFLARFTDKELRQMLANPKDKLSLKKRIEIILDHMLADPEKEFHKHQYIKTLNKLFLERLSKNV